MVGYDLLPNSGIWVSTLYRIVSHNHHKNQDPNSNGLSMEISKPMTPIGAKRLWQKHIMSIKILSMYACSTQKVAGCLTKQPGKTVVGSGWSFDVAMALQD